ncbi:TrmH family RNA methyltransferase [Corynebacterium liangguodongii]|uniref:rRNA methyltransferase n=1 Tax=Corynebacterium liangguodongii TaxID=2079535 RepID=A0A2S0WCY7_9CORY|nr:RNA methyltransferase [Corynebacterium liangguodongii]AWB83620.1 rRNA methyltransferase [Corynebacterium liangguodongii]PWB99572.1 RNA methyltransferase [Corynebacterium liangguodongii]
MPCPQRTRIDDPQDPRLDDVRDLKHSDSRGGLVYAEGPLICGRMVHSRFPLSCVVGFGGRLDSFLATFGADLGDVPVYEVTRPVLAEVAGYDMHRGLIAVASRPAPLTVAEVLDGARSLVILEGVGDHENIGAIFRNAAGMGIDGVLFGAGTADPLYRRSVRVSMGHALRTPFAHVEGTVTTWQRGLEELRVAGWRLVSLTPAEEASHLADALVDAAGRPYDKVAFLVGGEGPGLTEHAMRATDIRARIPMAPGTDSLNVATSAAIAFYERQRSLR